MTLRHHMVRAGDGFLEAPADLVRRSGIELDERSRYDEDNDRFFLSEREGAAQRLYDALDGPNISVASESGKWILDLPVATSADLEERGGGRA